MIYWTSEALLRLKGAAVGYLYFVALWKHMAARGTWVVWGRSFKLSFAIVGAWKYRQYDGYMHLVITQCFNHQRLCLYIIDSIIGWHTKLHWHLISILYLAHEVIVLFWSLLHVTGKQEASLQSSLAVYGKGKFFCEERAYSFAPFAHTTLFWPWNSATWCHVIQHVPMLYGLLSHMQPAFKFSCSSTQT